MLKLSWILDLPDIELRTYDLIGKQFFYLGNSILNILLILLLLFNDFYIFTKIMKILRILYI